MSDGAHKVLFEASNACEKCDMVMLAQEGRTVLKPGSFPHKLEKALLVSVCASVPQTRQCVWKEESQIAVTSRPLVS